MSTESFRIAIIHDVLHRYGGAERVVENLLQIWPHADLFVSRHTQHEENQPFTSHTIYTTFMQRLPWFHKLAKFYTPLYPLAFESLDLRSYDVVVSSTAHFAKGVLTTPDQLHVCYCHTPPRFLYQYRSESSERKKGFWAPAVTVLDHRLRMYDYSIAQRPDVFLTNSQTTADRIKTFYQRDAQIVYPPVDIDLFAPTQPVTKSDYFLVVSRLIPYKNIDLIIKTFRTRTEKLIVVGDGPQREFLQGLASRNVEFVGFVSQQDQVKYYQQAKAFIVATEDEDFGITPVEAMAAGTPVVAYKSGGVNETVVDGKTGVLYTKNDVESLNKALDSLAKTSLLSSEELTVHARSFSTNAFKANIQKIIDENLLQKDQIRFTSLDDQSSN